MVKGSVIGPYLLNTYSGIYAYWNETQEPVLGYVETARDKHGVLIGPMADSDWLHVVPDAIRQHLIYVNDRYKPDGIIITENGVDVPGENDMPLAQALQDDFRVDFYRKELEQVARAVREAKVPLKGYIAWSLEDNFEWADGYNHRFGITYVNFTTQVRYPKASAAWFTKIISLADGGNLGAAVITTAAVNDSSVPLWVYGLLAGLAVPFIAIGAAYALSGDKGDGRKSRSVKQMSSSSSSRRSKAKSVPKEDSGDMELLSREEQATAVEQVPATGPAAAQQAPPAPPLITQAVPQRSLLPIYVQAPVITQQGAYAPVTSPVSPYSQVRYTQAPQVYRSVPAEVIRRVG